MAGSMPLTIPRKLRIFAGQILRTAILYSKDRDET